MAFVKEGKIPFQEHGAQEQLLETLGKSLDITSDISLIRRTDFIIVSLGTPLDAPK